MPNMTLALPEALKAKMDQFKEINWSEVARQAIYEKTLMLEKMNQMLAGSKLSEPETESYAVPVKKSVLKKHAPAEFTSEEWQKFLEKTKKEPATKVHSRKDALKHLDRLSDK